MRHWRNPQSGQVIILAVVIMLLLSILSAVFVALVTHSLTQSGRQEDVILAETAAESATNYVHSLLLENPEYRPARPTGLSENYYTDLEISRGWGPPVGSDLSSAFNEMVHFVKFEVPSETGDLGVLAASQLTDVPARTLVRVRYSPRDYFDADGDGDTSEFPPISATNPAFDQVSRFIEITTIGQTPTTPGLTRVDNAFVPLLTPDYLFSISDYGKSEIEQTFGMPYSVDIDGNGVNSGGLEDLTEATQRPAVVGGLFSNTGVRFWGYTRFVCPRPPASPLGDRGDGVFVAGRITMDGVADPTAAVPTSPSGNPLAGFVQTDDGGTPPTVLAVGAASDATPFPAGGIDPLTWLDGMASVDATLDPARSVQRITPPNLSVTSADSSVPKLREIAEASGASFLNAGAPDNTARYGFGRALFIRNDNDRQVFDRDLLTDEWRQRGAGANSPYWHGPLYTPPGVEIVLYEIPQPGLDWYATNLGNDPTVPDILVVRHPDPQGRYEPWLIPYSSAATAFDPWATLGADSVAALDANGDGIPDDRCWFDYPADGLIYCTGNVRISGKLPAGPYNLTVVTPGNIYVEGDLLSPSDWSALPYEDPTNSRLALLAEENVVINGTRCALRGLRTTADVQPAARGDTKHVKYVLGPGQQLEFWFGFAGTDEEQNLLGNPGASAPVTDGNVFIKLRVRGSQLSAFDMYLNGIQYDFDRSDTATPDIDPCKQMNGKVQILAIPVLRDATNSPIDLNNDGTVEAPFGSPRTGLDPRPGELNHIRIAASPQMTRPVEILGMGVEVRTGAVLPLNDTLPPGTPDGVEDGPMLLQRVGGYVHPAMDCVVHALMYAQRGTFFIIPGEFWDWTAAALDLDGNGTVDPAEEDRDASAVPDYAESRRWNVRLRIYGAITQSYVADPQSVEDWTDKWSYPLAFAAMTDGAWGLIEYRYDPGLRSNRPFAPFTTLPRLPYLPVSPDLVYFGKLAR